MQGKLIAMKKKIIDRITHSIAENRGYDDKQIKTIKYGLEGLYNNLTKILVTLILVLIFDCFIEFVCLFISYLFMRKYSFGIHANTSLMCWLTTIPIYVGGSLLIKYFDFNIYIVYPIWVFGFISFILWAPADTPKRPLIHENTRKKQKIKTCIIAIVYLLIIFIAKSTLLRDSITIAIALQAIIINPLTYKITKTPFNNYKTYLKSV